MLQEYHKSDVPFSVLQFRGYIMLTCCIIGEVNLDHSVKVVSARFLLHKVTISPFGKNPGRDTLRVCKSTIFPQNFARYFDTAGESCLQQLILRCLNGALKENKIYKL